MAEILSQGFSENKRYQFQVSQEKQVFTVVLLSYHPEWQDFVPVDNMRQETKDLETATKLGRAMLALLE